MHFRFSGGNRMQTGKQKISEISDRGFKRNSFRTFFFFHPGSPLLVTNMAA